MTPSVTTSRILATLALAGVALAAACVYVHAWANLALVSAYVALALYAARVNARRLEQARTLRRARKLAQARTRAPWGPWGWDG